jgi:hypothetical protein
MPFDGKFLCLRVKISHNATLKYANTMKASWNITFLGFFWTKIKAIEKILAEILRRYHQFGLFLQYSIKLTLSLLMCFEKACQVPLVLRKSMLTPFLYPLFSPLYDRLQH